MPPEITDKHREMFKSLASGWLRIGASCVQLLRGDDVLINCPDLPVETAPVLMAVSRPSNLTLRVYGMKDSHWLPTAESMLEVFASLLTADTDLDSLTGALVETQDRLVAIYELTQATRRTLDVPVLLDLLIQQSQHLLNVDGGFAVLIEKGKKPLIHQNSDKPLHPAHVEAAASLFRRDPTRNIFKDSETLPAGLRNVMMVALPVRDEVFGAFGVFNKTGNFDAPDLKLAKAIAGHIGAQLESAMLHKETLERARLETEMDIARKVQTAILPQTLPQIEGLDIYAASAPAFEVGGDFFDLVTPTQDALVFTVGDITGKGMPAAMLMSMTHTVIKSASRYMPFKFPHQVINRLNHDLFDDFSSVGMFSTVFIGQLDLKDLSLNFSNAGHSPVMYLPVNGEPVMLEAQDIPVGILEDHPYSTAGLRLSRGDVFIVASDGFPESCDASGEMFGYERMMACLSASRNMSAREIATRLTADVEAFCDGSIQSDDRTIIVLKVMK